MLLKISIPHKMQFRMIPNLKALLLGEYSEMHYIGGAEILPPPLDLEKETDAIAGLCSGIDEEISEARSLLVEHNLRLVVYIAKKFDNTGIGVEDLISIGTIGLIKAINTYDEEKGVQLATYSARCIENEILMLLRANKKHSGVVSLSDSVGTDKDGNDLTLMDLLSDDGESVIETVGKKIERTKFLKLIRSVLSDREFTVICLRYGLKGSAPLPQREVASFLKISRSYISRIEKKSIEKIKKEIIKSGYRYE